MLLEEFKKELKLVGQSLESKLQTFYHDVKEHDDEIILVFSAGIYRLRIFFKTDDISENITTFYFDIATSYVDIDYISGEVFYADLKKDIEKVVKFFDSYIEYYN